MLTYSTTQNGPNAVGYFVAMALIVCWPMTLPALAVAVMEPIVAAAAAVATMVGRLGVVPAVVRPTLVLGLGPRPTMRFVRFAIGSPIDGAFDSDAHRVRAGRLTVMQSKRCSANIGGRLANRFSVESMQTGRLVDICVWFLFVVAKKKER